jgi:hypothetical protein
MSCGLDELKREMATLSDATTSRLVVLSEEVL